MARQEHDREDLLRQATALVRRVELACGDWPEPVVAGFRRDGALSIYFGGDPVYQLNPQGKLRRAFIDGRPYKAEHGRLVSLQRERQAEATLLVRHELTDGEQAELLCAARARLLQLAAALGRKQFRLAGQAPADARVLEELLERLTVLPEELEVAERL